MTKNTAELNTLEALGLLGRLQPYDKNCPGEKGRVETWFPFMCKTEGEGIKVLYRCSFNGREECRGCISTGSYVEVRRP
jgi:hypothetical protein